MAPPDLNPLARRTQRAQRLVRLRRVLASGLLVAAGVVLALYLYNQHTERRAEARSSLDIPKLGLSVQQSAHGLTISKDSNGKPVFRLSAERAQKLRGSGRDELHNVRIVVYGSDGVHSDQITGADFAYDENAGQASATGPVAIDLSVLPGGGPTAPIRIEAQGLALDVKTGMGVVNDGVRFSYLNATGSARQARIDSHAGQLVLSGAVEVNWKRPGEPDLIIKGGQAELRRMEGDHPDAAQLSLSGGATMQSGTMLTSAGEFIFHLRADRTLRHLDALGDLHATDTASGRALAVAAHSGAADFTPAGPHHTAVSHIALQGAVAIADHSARQRAELRSESAVFLFGGDHQLRQLQARGGTNGQAQLRLAGSGRSEQLNGAALDFNFAPSHGRGPEAPQLASVEAVARRSDAPVTMALNDARGPLEAQAGQLSVTLDGHQQPQRAHASGDVHVRQTIASSQQVRASRSDTLDLRFAAPAGGAAQLAQAVESGHVELSQAGRQLQADTATYDVAAGRARLNADSSSAFTHGLVHGADADTTFTAPAVTWTQRPDGSSELSAAGGVTLTHAAAKPDQAPVVVSAVSLTWEQARGEAPLAKPVVEAGGFVPNLAGTGVFSGGVRLVQVPNVLTGDRLTVDGARHTLLVTGHVRTTFMPTESAAQPLAVAPSAQRAPVTIAAERLSFDQSTGMAVYQGQVRLRNGDTILTAPRLQARVQPASSQLQSAVASGGVKITQPGRTLTAEQASFDFATRQGRLSGGPPSIFDAEQGRISGDPLTFSLSSDEIQVGSKSGARASGQTTIPQP